MSAEPQPRAGMQWDEYWHMVRDRNAARREFAAAAGRCGAIDRKTGAIIGLPRDAFARRYESETKT
jgi:hypothetical protein